MSAAVAAVLAGECRLAAQDRAVAEMTLEELLNVRVVAASRREQRPFESPRAITIVTAEDLARRNYRSTPDALQDAAGIFLQQTNDGGGAPILRGLIGNQVLLLVDGVRLNNAIYRLGPNQYLNTLDIHQIERIEVIRGPGSVLFGSDALGGVVNIVTKTRLPGDRRAFGVLTSGRVATADRGSVGRLGLTAGHRTLTGVGGVSVKSFGQIRSGGGVLQPFTGYDEWAADGKVGLAVRTGDTLTVTGQHVHQSNVQRADVLRSGSDLDYRWEPETRSLLSARYTTTVPAGFIRETTSFVAYQRQAEHILRRTAADAGRRRRLDDRDQTVSGGLQVYSQARGHRLTYGGEVQEDWVHSTRTDEVMATGQLISRRGTFADGARASARAAYLQDQIAVTPRVGIELGGRFSQYALDARLDDPATGSVPVAGRTRAVTGSAYLSTRMTPTLRLVGGVSQGFRAPNVDDVSVLGSFAGGFEVPNPELRPEQSLNLEVGVKFAGYRVLANATAFAARHRDLIGRTASQFDGLPFLDVNEDGIRSPSEPWIYKRHNIGRARTTGVEIDGQMHLSRRWHMGGHVNWIRGDDVTAREPLRRIPPLHGELTATFSVGAGYWLEGYSRFASAQRRLSSGDIADVRIGPDGTAGVTTVNVRGGASVPRLGRATIALENLTDAQYKWHGSGVERPGRNLVVGITTEF